MTKNKDIRIRVSEKQKEFLQKIAIEKEIDLTKYVMAAIIEKLAKDDKALDFINL